MMDDRTIADTVNTVRDIALNYHHTEQFRERIAHVLVPHLKRIAELERSATVLDAPAKVGNGTFGVGVKWSMVISAAQRLYARDMTPENESERIAKAKSATSFLETAVEQAARIAELERVQGVLAGALSRLSAACDKRCELLSREAYLSSLECLGMSEALQELDDARLNALSALAAAQKPASISSAATDVLAERRRQVEAEGWTPEHDDGHTPGNLASAAACYALNAGVPMRNLPPPYWPWHRGWWKPSTPRRDLIKAGALILAEIERIDRAAKKPTATCCNDDCRWNGPIEECVFRGYVGPLCPRCHEVVENDFAQKIASLRDMAEADFDAVFGAAAQQPSDLWAIHIPGPDEYHAAPSEEVAQAMAKQLNEDMARLFAERTITPATPSIAGVTASVVPWPSDAESHAKALIEFDASEWGIEQKPEGGSA